MQSTGIKLSKHFSRASDSTLAGLHVRLREQTGVVRR
jgi:hypothetical protein